MMIDFINFIIRSQNNGNYSIKNCFNTIFNNNKYTKNGNWNCPSIINFLIDTFGRFDATIITKKIYLFSICVDGEIIDNSPEDQKINNALIFFEQYENFTMSVEHRNFVKNFCIDYFINNQTINQLYLSSIIPNMIFPQLNTQPFLNKPKQICWQSKCKVCNKNNPVPFHILSNPKEHSHLLICQCGNIHTKYKKCKDHGFFFLSNNSKFNKCPKCT